MTEGTTSYLAILFVFIFFFLTSQNWMIFLLWSLETVPLIIPTGVIQLKLHFTEHKLDVNLTCLALLISLFLWNNLNANKKWGLTYTTKKVENISKGWQRNAIFCNEVNKQSSCSKPLSFTLSHCKIKYLPSCFELWELGLKPVRLFIP